MRKGSQINKNGNRFMPLAFLSRIASILIAAFFVQFCSIPVLSQEPAAPVVNAGLSSASTSIVAQSLAATSHAGLTLSPENNIDEKDSMDAAKINEQLLILASDTQLASDARAVANETWNKALANLNLVAEQKAQALEFQKRYESAPALLGKIKAGQASAATELATDSLAELTSSQINQSIELLESELRLVREKNLEIEGRISSMGQRRVELPDLLGEMQSRLRNFSEEAKAGVGNANEPAFMANARKAVDQTQKMLLRATIDTCQVQLNTYELRLELAKAQQSQVYRAISELEEKLKILRSFSNEAKRKEAEEATRRAKQELSQFSMSIPAIKTLVEENAGLAARRAELLSLSEEVTTGLDESRKRLTKILEDRKSLGEKVQTMGFSDYLGLLFRVKKTELPTPAIYREKIQRRKTLIIRIQEQLLELEDKADKMHDIALLQKEILSSLDKSTSEEKRKTIEAKLSEILQMRREYLDSLIVEYHSLFTRLGDLDSLERRLLDAIRQFESFINKHVFWIPSCQTLGLQHFGNGAEGLIQIFKSAKWGQLYYSFSQAVLRNPTPFVAAAFCFILLLWLRRRALNMNVGIAEQAANIGTDRFSLTLGSLLLTLVWTSTWPMLILFLSVLTTWTVEPVGPGKLLEEGLWRILPIVWALSFFRGFFRENGLASAHFRLRMEKVHKILKTKILALGLISVPLFLMSDIIANQPNERLQESLGRILFILSALSVAGLLHSIFSLKGKVFPEIEKNYSGKTVYRLRYLMYFLGVTAPVFMCVLAFLGYLFTAQQLFINLIQTIIAGFAAIFVHGFASRILQLQRRSLALKKAEELRNNPVNLEDAPVSLGKIPSDGKDELPIHVISQQTNTILLGLILFLFGFFMWNIWRDVLPAARILEKAHLYTVESSVSESVTLADGQVKTQIVQRMVDITLLELFMTIGVIALTILACQNIPGFLEFAILRRLPLDNGARFAITSLTNYVIIVIGLAYSLQLLGVGWNKVQWLITGVSVGLGFGLQEIFANFISGLILLFERPMRVGDVVTVGNYVGEVTKIQIRATTILSFDRQEVIVPNKDFVTGQIVNWTLSDRIFRLVIKVGVAYGTNPKKVQKILLQIVKENGKALATPPAVAILVGFGDSSLDFELRAFFDTPSNFGLLTSELNVAIFEAFAKEGIEIPFPQRDLHIIHPKPEDTKTLEGK